VTAFCPSIAGTVRHQLFPLCRENQASESWKPAGIVVQRKGKNCRGGGLCKEKERISNGEDCEEKRKEFQMGRGAIQNTNEQYHAAKSYFLIQRGIIPVIF